MPMPIDTLTGSVTETTVPTHIDPTVAHDVTVVRDIHMWLEPGTTLTPGAVAPEPIHRRAFLGDVISLQGDNLVRALSLGAVALPVHAETARESVVALSGLASDEELAAMDAQELVAYIGQHPHEARRVHTFETTSRGKRVPRKAVVAATGIEEMEHESGPDGDEGTGPVFD